MSVEKRVNFTIRDRAARPHAYDFWRTLFRLHAAGESNDMAAEAKGWQTQLAGQQVDVTGLPQWHPLQRSDDVELWRLQWVDKTTKHHAATAY